MDKLLSSSAVEALEIAIEEATRSTDEGVKHFIEPAQGTLARAVAKRPHIVFGRRGSGKSSLLRKTVSDLTVDRRPIAFVDLESFKGHSYPDVLISILIQTLERFAQWLETAAVNPANKTSFWKKFFGKIPTRAPFDKVRTKALSERLETEIASLKGVLLQEDDVATETQSVNSQSSENSLRASGDAKLGAVKVGVKGSTGEKLSVEEKIKESFTRDKLNLLHRRIIEYQKIFRDMSALSGGDSYLVLDDLYHIRRIDQPRVIDYFHRLGKSANLWIKVGTIRHRSAWYVNGDPPVGMKIGDDGDEIDLDLTLEKYQQAKDFLSRILRGFFDAADLKIDEILTDGALDRLVLASGGVARDFLGIFRRSIAIARNRTASARGPKIGVEDVNAAAGEYDQYKREELNRDTFRDEERPIEDEFASVREFCLESANANCFLIEKDSQRDRYDRIEELTDLRLVHKVRSRVTISSRPGKLFEAYMLDVSQYTASRKKRELEVIEFWRADSTERLRRVSLIYPGQSLSE
jgi:AAA+ ATPase superfamily predicted ATPase